MPLPIAEVLSIANEFERGDRLADAQRLLDHVLSVAPNHGDALHLAGVIAFRQGDIAKSLELMEASLRHGIDTPLYLRNICEVYRALGRLDEALQAAQRATALIPADPLCLHNQAVIHHHRLELQAALDCAERALRIDRSLPGAHFIRAETLLLRGEWAEGWEEYEWRFRIPGAAALMPPTTRPQWDGTPLPDRTLLLIADQGFGDVIQFARYLPWAAERCPNIAIACSAEVRDLLHQIAPDALRFLRWEDAPDYAAFCPMSGLPRLAGTRIDTVPAPIPYLRADPTRVAHWAERLDGLVPRSFRRVGAIWAGRPSHNNDRNRSALLADFRPLADVAGIALLALQKGPKTGQAGAWYGRAPLINIGAEIQDYDDTMAILDNLDLLITVDTSVAHLAGAMGRPVWIMLPRTPDWRWLLDRSDTPWYPSARLFRQQYVRRWDDVVQAIATALRALPRHSE
ncbi:MAG TPA: tetratricopeptide repeat-containing glycosyltransferase family protein [Acetobacteraceae bacterium]|nr:tetratricopeptide repeat-containing glycosyltransferase family protein [Acetobacteraceae bacterium]